MSSCLSSDAVRELVRGDLAEGPLAAAREHVDACERCAERVHALRIDGADLATRGSTREVGAGVPVSGTPIIEGYDVLEEMHRGAQGTVHRAIQLSTGREVALKVLHSFDSEAERRRFEREMEIASTLRHPNIVTVHDGGISDGQCFLAMELIAGENVVEHVRRRGLGVRETLEIFAGVCAGVAHAQQRGVIHRDLKPSNVRVDALGQPRVLDFGLAKSLTAGSALTATGTFLGTLAYASPEQLRGDASSADMRSDVYSLGALLHEMLTGELPHDLGSDVVQAVRDVAEKTVTAPSTLRSEVDDEVDTIVLEALAKEPERRYANAEALRRDVERYLAGEVIAAKRDSSMYVLGKLLRRHRLLVGFAAVVAVLATAAAWVILTERGRRLDEERRAAEAASAAERDAEAARSTTELLQRLVGLSSPAQMDRPSISGREIIDEVSDWVEDGMPTKPEIQGPLLASLGKSLLDRHLVHDALPVLEQAVEQQRVHLGEDHLDVATAWAALGAARNYAADHPGSAEGYRRALAIRQRALGPEAPETGKAQMGLAWQHWRNGDADAAAALLLEVEKTFRAAGEPEIVARALMWRSRLRKSKDIHESVAIGRESLRVLEEAGLSSSRSAEAVLGNLGNVLRRAGELEEALAHAREVLRLRRQRLGEMDAAVGEAIQNVGHIAHLLGDHEEAEARVVEAIDLWERLGRPPGRTAYRHHESLADIYWATGRLEKAEAAFEESIGIALEWWPEDSKYVLRVKEQLAELRAQMEEAEQ